MSMPSFTVERVRHRGQRTAAQRVADRAFGLPELRTVAIAPSRTVRTPLSGGELASLERLAERLNRNEPNHARPEKYHIERSEIHDALRRVIGALREGHAVPEIGRRERT